MQFPSMKACLALFFTILCEPNKNNMTIKNVIGIITIGSIAMFSCNDNKSNEPDPVTKDTVATTPVAVIAKQASTEGTSVKIASTEVPDTIRTGFERRSTQKRKGPSGYHTNLLKMMTFQWMIVIIMLDLIMMALIILPGTITGESG